ncbi:hypothetical protein AM571_PB00002 (plasmid) [Rhizobium etli 8C-3]|uniref:Uncharacterized protein n=1 Tax=Rhizobium etli 8C-3 TaxID=538025 RepID=A0A1L5PB49_RHIET|nr:hypothetical protein AM571_PB00002 [Rhizobium etli 8C-3]
MPRGDPRTPRSPVVASLETRNDLSDNGTKLTSNAILAWSKDHRVEWLIASPRPR